MGGLPLGRLGGFMGVILPVQKRLDKPLDPLYSVRTLNKGANMNKKIWWVFKQGQKWDGPHFSERKADQACVRARQDGHGLVYVEKTWT